MLYRHINSELPQGYLDAHSIRSGPEFRFALFPLDAFQELVRASEGVPRDLIFIFTKSFFAAQRKQAEKIEKDFVLQEARQWFEQDKYQNLDGGLRRGLDALIKHVILKGRSRTFLVRSEDEKHALLQRLLDARVLHLLRRGYVESDSTGDRYSVFNFDYGTYVHQCCPN